MALRKTEIHLFKPYLCVPTMEILVDYIGQKTSRGEGKLLNQTALSSSKMTLSYILPFVKILC